MSRVADGKYLAKPVGGQIGRSGNKNTPGIAILFEFDYEGRKTQLSWRGWFTEKTSERTFETLAILGFDENKPYINGNEIPASSFDHNAVVELVVENEEFTNEQGRVVSAPKIKWVNKAGGSGFGFAETVDVKNALAGIDVRKEMLVARQRLGIGGKKLTTQPVKNHAPVMNEADEIPF